MVSLFSSSFSISIFGVLRARFGLPLPVLS
jgi:hypothetical protein